MKLELTVFQGRVGDRNNLAIPGAQALVKEFSAVLGLEVTDIGVPEPAINGNWALELEQARSALEALQLRFEHIYAQGARSVAATSRCAASIATLPVIAKYHPDACVVWLDAHADLNTPESTTSGYLGGLAIAAPLGLWSSGLGAGLGAQQLILVGQRDMDPFEEDLIGSQSICQIQVGPDLAQELRKAVRGRPVYVHLDCDVLDPGIVPTDYVHEDGMSLNDLHGAMQALAQSNVVGLEVAEFQNAWVQGGKPVSPKPLVQSLVPLLNRMVR